jgi:hypothetical protein
MVLSQEGVINIVHAQEKVFLGQRHREMGYQRQAFAGGARKKSAECCKVGGRGRAMERKGEVREME